MVYHHGLVPALIKDESRNIRIVSQPWADPETRIGTPIMGFLCPDYKWIPK